MRVIQILGWTLLLVTLLFGLYEVVQHYRAGSKSLTAIGHFWFQMTPAGFNRIHGFMSATVGTPWVWLVQLPVLFVTGVLSLICLFATYAVRGDR